VGIVGLPGAQKAHYGAHMGTTSAIWGPYNPYGAHMRPMWAIWAIYSPDGAHMGPMWEIPGSEGLI